ncbi:endonuclease/exonuclease/phosphatase [Schizothecium vesticola]|uniref:Endonuclease/exonuclease/phosphatase n=1 Tax=Schizothecium vesticola TaxID=314040 RepID=A0AA40EHQ5_9PEZI|nr:endonuclease/exonuclease/phosphatase [Schizothecium vesticola]
MALTLLVGGGRSISSLRDLPFAAESRPALPLRVITHNIRYAATDLFEGERPWSERAPLVLNQLQHEVRHVVPTVATGDLTNASPSYPGAFICLQEKAEPASGPVWKHIGVGRDDGKRKGEYSPIIYPVQLLELLHHETSIRLFTVGVFEHRRTRRRVLAANTYLDNAGSESRRESVAIILRTLQRVHGKWAAGGNETLGIVLVGDFNSFTTQEAYVAMRESGYLRNLHEEVALMARYGDIITFTGFGPDQHKDEQGGIDFVWLGPADKPGAESISKPEGYAVLPNLFEAGVYLSGHRAVVGDVTLL